MVDSSRWVMRSWLDSLSVTVGGWTLCLSLSVSVSLCQSLSLSLPVSVCLCLSLSLYLSLSVSLCLDMSWLRVSSADSIIRGSAAHRLCIGILLS